MQPLELDGYLAGVAVAPETIERGYWLAKLWGRGGPAFTSVDQMQTVIGAVVEQYNDIVDAIDDGFERLEANEPHDYKPLFLAAGEKPKHDLIRTWVTGFGKAMALTPEAWSGLIRDERMQLLVTPIVGFMDVFSHAVEPAMDMDELLDEALTEIPRTVILLRKLAQLRAERRVKLGRNDPCPCGSGHKYKRCCGAN